MCGNFSGADEPCASPLHARSLRTSPENAPNLRLAGGEGGIRTPETLSNSIDGSLPSLSTLSGLRKSICVKEILFAKDSALVVPQNLIPAQEKRGDSPRRANAVDFESGKRCRDSYTALFLSQRTRRQRDASLRDRTERTADGYLDRLRRAVLGRDCA
jgi:hypothetical protein